MQDRRKTELEDRDARTDALLGAFFVLLGLAVALGVFYAELTVDRLLNGVAAALLLLVGAGFAWRSRVLRRR